VPFDRVSNLLPRRIWSRLWVTALCGFILVPIAGIATARDHHSVLRPYGIRGYLTRGGFFIDQVYGGSEARDDGLLVADLIVRGNGDPIREADDVAEDLVNSRLGRGGCGLPDEDEPLGAVRPDHRDRALSPGGDAVAPPGRSGLTGRGVGNLGGAGSGVLPTEPTLRC